MSKKQYIYITNTCNMEFKNYMMKLTNKYFT